MAITRFAPSPTGFLHVGNLRTAIIAWLTAKSLGGEMILRIDDTDKERSTKEYEDEIINDLKWCGLTWSRIEHQSKRLEIYKKSIEKLIEIGDLYPCYETQNELELKKKILLNQGLPPIYDKAALKLTAEQKKQFESEGRKPHWRFKLKEKDIIWKDGIMGEVHFKSSNLSDPIVVLADYRVTYMLASVIDDIDMGVTDIIRGSDHLTNSAIQIQMFESLGSKAPNFHHLPLLKMQEQKLSKRKGESGAEIQSLREEEGIIPLVLISYLAKLGYPGQISVSSSVEELLKFFNINKYNRASCNYSLEDLKRLNKHYIHCMDFAAAKPYLKEHNLEYIDEDFWNRTHANISSIAEIEEWWNICKNEITPHITDKEYLKLAAELLPKDINNEAWDLWINLLKQNTKRSGKDLFAPLRMALTAQENGPELKNILPLLGYERVVKRLKGERI